MAERIKVEYFEEPPVVLEVGGRRSWQAETADQFCNIWHETTEGSDHVTGAAFHIGEVSRTHPDPRGEAALGQSALVAQILDPQPVLHPYRGHAPMFRHGRMASASF